MITMSNLGSNGRLGNQLFQRAFIYSICKKYHIEYSRELLAPIVREPHFHYTPDFYAGLDYRHHIDFSGYFQSEKYFSYYREDIKRLFKPESYVVSQAIRQLGYVFDKPTIAIHVRRGDYVNNNNYEYLPIQYYIYALKENFGSLADYNLIFFSDDIEYCRNTFGAFDNAYFSEGNDAEEDLALMSLCDHFIIANSSFSWWGAWLGEKSHSIIVRPNYLFAGDLLKQNDSKDFYPERWKICDHKKQLV